MVDGSMPDDDALLHFQHSHLPPKLAEVSRRFGELASALIQRSADSGQRRLALMYLLLAKDAAVRAANVPIKNPHAWLHLNASGDLIGIEDVEGTLCCLNEGCDAKQYKGTGPDGCKGVQR